MGWLTPSPLNTMAPFGRFWSGAGPVESQRCRLCLSSGQTLGRAPPPQGSQWSPESWGVGRSFIHPFSRCVLSPHSGQPLCWGDGGNWPHPPRGAP